MKTWVAGWVAISVMVIGTQTSASDSYVATAEGDLSASSYYGTSYKAINVDTITEKSQKLQNEIVKGASVYSPDELKTLELKLKDTQEQLSVLTHGG